MKWIKCENEMPSENELVLIHTRNADIYALDWYKDEDWFYNHRCDVTHWMPLPEPPHEPKLVWQYELQTEPNVWHDATDKEYECGFHLSRYNWRRVEK